MSATLEHTIWVIPPYRTFQRCREACFLCESIDIDAVEPITTIWDTLCLSTLVSIGFRSQIPGIRGWVDDSSGLFQMRIVLAEQSTTQ